MDREEFIDSIKTKRDYAIMDVEENLESPPGRSPSNRDIMLSSFYNSLNEDQKANIKEIISESVDMAIFSFLCVLDHVSFLEDTEEKTKFELYATKGDSRILLNDPDEEELHDIFNSLVLK